MLLSMPSRSRTACPSSLRAAIAKQPREYDEALYEERNLIERFSRKLKNYRRIVSRFDKKAANYMAFVAFAATLTTLA